MGRREAGFKALGELAEMLGTPVLDQFGMPKLVLDAEGNPKPIGTLTSKTDMRSYVGLLDSAVQVQNMVGYGPLDGVPNEFD